MFKVRALAKGQKVFCSKCGNLIKNSFLEISNNHVEGKYCDECVEKVFPGSTSEVNE